MMIGRYCLTALIAAAVISTPALGQSDDDNPYPFIGVIGEDAVYVRSGPSQTYYPVDKLDQGALVKVHENIYGWYVVDPPPDAFSYISKAYVRVEGDGSAGTVTGHKIRVRAPSPAGPEKSYRTLAQLNEGDPVQIVGEQGGFLKIVPPPEARLFIHRSLVDRATQEQIDAAHRAAAQAAQDAQAAQEQPAVAPDPAPPVDPITEPVEVIEIVEPTPVIEEAPATQPEAVEQVAEPTAPDQVTPVEPVAPLPPPTELNIEVLADGTPAIAGQSYTADQVEHMIRQIVVVNEDLSVIVRAEQDVDEAHVQNIVDLAEDAGARQVAVALIAPTLPLDQQPIQPADPPAPIFEPPNESLAALEQRFADADALPLEQQPLEDLLDDYEQIAMDENLTDPEQQTVNVRVQLIKTRLRLMSVLADMADTQQQLHVQRAQAMAAQQAADDARAAQAAQAARIQSQTPAVHVPVGTPRSYTAVGRLLASTLYTGETLPRLFRLVDPLSGLTIAYVRPTAQPQMIPLLGQLVGIVGSRKYDAALKLNVMTVRTVDVLAAAAP